MSIWLSTLLEILKLTIPALIVYFTVSRLLQQYLNHQYNTQLGELRKKQQDATLPLRLQAYERLSLFCERIDLPNLMIRIRPEGLTVPEYRLSLMLAIQQEYEHNITQQVYISDQLWEIVKMARDDAMNVINHAADQLQAKDEGRKLADAIISIIAQRGGSAQATALQAIKKEAGVLFG